MELLIHWFRKLYNLVFGYDPSEFSSELFRNFVLAAGSTGIATILTFGINILGARYMGPSEFGKWNLIGSWAEFMVIIPLFGFTAAVPRYLGASKDEGQKQRFIGSAFQITMILSLVCFPIFWLIQKQWRVIPDSSLAGATFIYAIILAFFYLVQSFFQGMKQFKRLSILWVVSALGFVATVLIYIFVLHNHSYKSLYLGNVIRLAFMVVSGMVLFGSILWHFSKGESKQLLHFGSYSMLSVVAGFFSLGSIDNIMLNHFLGPSSVGLYSAYMVAFSIFIGKIVSAFSQVFLPMASGSSNPKDLLSGVLNKVKILFFPLVFGLFILIWLVFGFYGKGFVFDPKLAFMIGISNALYGILVIIGNIVITIGIKGARIGVLFAITSASINVIFNYILIPRFQLYGTVFATILATLTVMIWAIRFIRTNTFKASKQE